MKTRDDRYFCILASCEEPMSATRLTCYMYMLQLAGFELGYKYKITGNGLCSREFDDYFNQLASQGVLIPNTKGDVILNLEVNEEYIKFPLLHKDAVLIDSIVSFLNTLDFEDLLFICLTSITISDILQNKTPEEFLAQRATVESILKTLSPVYSDENFDVALKVRREIQSGEFKFLPKLD